MKTLSEYTLSRAIDYHTKNNLPFTENVFRPHSEMSYSLFKEAKRLYESGKYQPKHTFEQEILESDIGEFDIYENISVPLDIPLQYEDKEPELNKPKRGGKKKFYVYVRDPSTGNVKKVSFGDPNMSVKFDDEGARKSFVARHDCANKTDKTTPGYWSCRVPKFAASVGLSGGGNFFW